MSDSTAALQAEELEVLRSIYGDELRELGPDHLEVDVPIVVDEPGAAFVLDAEPAAKCVHVTHLALTLVVRFQQDYPTASPPAFAITSAWLDPEHHGKAIISALMEEWDALGPAPIVSSWVEVLRAMAAEPYIQGTTHLSDANSEEGEVLPVPGGRVVRHPQLKRDALARIVRFDCERSAAESSKRVTRCGICFDDVLGLECSSFRACGHTFCNACLKTTFELHIKAGDASTITCPECAAAVLPTEVAAVVSPSLHAEYEDRTLQSSLAGMEDVVWCPRSHCQAPVVLDRRPDGNFDQLAQCSQCHFAFCTLCKRSWHGYGPCHDFRQKWLDADEEERKNLEERFGSAIVAEMQSAHWIEASTQPCPGCKAAIQKNGGCNHMTCGKCGHQWCWICKGRYTQDHYVLTACNQYSQDFFEELAGALAEAETRDGLELPWRI